MPMPGYPWLHHQPCNAAYISTQWSYKAISMYLYDAGPVQLLSVNKDLNI